MRAQADCATSASVSGGGWAKGSGSWAGSSRLLRIALTDLHLGAAKRTQQRTSDVQLRGLGYRRPRGSERRRPQGRDMRSQSVHRQPPSGCRLHALRERHLTKTCATSKPWRAQYSWQVSTWVGRLRLHPRFEHYIPPGSLPTLFRDVTHSATGKRVFDVCYTSAAST